MCTSSCPCLAPHILFSVRDVSWTLQNLKTQFADLQSLNYSPQGLHDVRECLLERSGAVSTMHLMSKQHARTLISIMPHAQFLYIQYMHMYVCKNKEIVVLTLSDIKAWIVPSYESRWNRHNETVNCMTLHVNFLNIQYLYTHLYMHMHVYRKNEIVVLTFSDTKAWIISSYESRWNRHNWTVNCMALHAHFLNVQYLYTHVHRKNEIVGLTLYPNDNLWFSLSNDWTGDDIRY